MPCCPLLPRPLCQKHRNQSEERPCHLQPHHARKPRHRRPHRPPQPSRMLLGRRQGPLGLRHLLDHAIGLRRVPRRTFLCPRSPHRRRCRRRVRRLQQRLCGMPSAIPQCASETNPVHVLQCTVPPSPHQVSSSDLYSIPISCIQPLTKFEVTVETGDKGASMKNLVWLVSGLAAAMVGFLVWDRTRVQPVEELAHRLEAAWSDHHTIV